MISSNCCSFLYTPVYKFFYNLTDVDASGKRESGVYGGNTLWYGSFDECNKLPDSRYCLTIFPGNMTLYQNKAEVNKRKQFLLKIYQLKMWSNLSEPNIENRTTCSSYCRGVSKIRHQREGLAWR